MIGGRFFGLGLGPQLSDSMPAAEAVAAAPGSAGLASRGDHTHPRLTSTTSGSLNASGEATITFTRTFTGKPAVIVTPVEAVDQPPVMFKVKSWTTNAGGQYTGCVIKGYRGQQLPATLTLLTALVSFNVFAGSANGVEFSLIAVAPSS